MDRERSNHGKVQHKFQKEGREGHARIQARQAEKWTRAEACQEPQAGSCDRALRGAALGRSSAKSEVVFAQWVEPKPERVEPQWFEPQQEPERIQPQKHNPSLDKPQVYQQDQTIG